MSAFIELTLKGGYEAVTIEDIICKANVGRSTLYLHYAGKEALLTESLKYPSRGLAACVRRDISPRALVPLLEHFREQRSVNRIFFHHPIRSRWVKCLAGLLEKEMAAEPRAARKADALPRALVALTLAEMQIALVTHWLSNAAGVATEDVARALIALSAAVLDDTLRSRSQPVRTAGSLQTP